MKRKGKLYVLEGEWEYQIEGKGAMTLKASGVLFIPAGIPAGVKHGAKNVGSGKGSELATYIHKRTPVSSTIHRYRAGTPKTLSSPRHGAFAPFVRPTPQSDPWRHDRGRIVS
jgi:hypothetical protein